MIPFTQYHLPDGRKSLVTIDRPEEVESKAREVIAQGYVFEAEVLTTGEVSFTVADPTEGVDICIEVTTNGPEALGAVDRLVRSAYNTLKGRA